MGFVLSANALVSLLGGLQDADIIRFLISVGLTNVVANSFGKIRGGNELRGSIYRKSLQEIYEYLMPQVEIDRYLRGLAYLNLKGRNLVRLKIKDE